MGTPWPPPEADDHTYGVGRGGPNYVLRRALVAILAIALVAGIAWFVVGRGGDDGDATGTDAPAWDAVVLQRTDGSISVVDRDGDELSSTTTDLVGVTDIGLTGKVLLGLAGDPAADGIGVLTLEDGSIDDIDVAYDELRRLGRTSLLVASDTAGTGLELVDAGAGSTIDLLALSDADSPLADLGSLRVDDEATHVAFSELRSFETVVVDVAEATGVSLPGALFDLAFDRVLTVTNRGDTVLVDLFDVSGERVGTVETAPIHGAMLVGASTAIVVTADGIVSAVDFAEESVDEVTRLATVLPLPPGTDVAAEPEIVDGVLVLADRTRMALFGERFVAFVDETGSLVRSVDVADRVDVFLEPVTTDQCISVGDGGGPYTLLDARTGVIVTSFDDGTLVADSEDACVVAFGATGAGGVDVVAGVELDRRLDDRVQALSADGTAALQASTRSISWVALDDDGSSDPIELVEIGARDARVSAAAFATR